MQSRICQEYFKGPQIFVTRQNPLLLDSYRMLGHVISRTWPIKVALIDVSGDTKVFASQVRTRLQKRKKGDHKIFNYFF